MRFFAGTILLLVFASTVRSQDHAEYMEGPFDTPQEVTETCLGCHEDAGGEILKTRHWKWRGELGRIEGDTMAGPGKLNLINNFCIGVPSNWPRCTSCHISYGWKDSGFDFSSENNIDCLVCHDQSGTYIKSPAGAGMPDPDVDLVLVASSVGLSRRRNCGSCHFNGGGGSGVKHGDLDQSLNKPSSSLDVHMGGLAFECTECHTTEKHVISGGSHGSMVHGSNLVSCLDCHDEEVHGNGIINRHISAVACESCHIPTFARKVPTLMFWDWSTAGQDKKVKKDRYGKETYSKMKGDFKWARNEIPEYFWYNGKAAYYRHGESIDPTHPVRLNRLEGDILDPEARISPFKIMRGKQPYDTHSDILIIPKLYGENGFWQTFDWNGAASEGMKAAGLVYSGSMGFVETEMYWPIHHMVAPAKKALKCSKCHSKRGILDWKELGYEGDPMRKSVKKKGERLKKSDS